MSEPTRTLETLELAGGALCLDFVNTINSRREPEHDYLLHYSDLLGWANKVELLSPAQMSILQKQAKQNPSQAQVILEAARNLRELFYRLFSSIAQGSEPNKADTEAFFAHYAEAISHGKLVKTGDHFITVWKLEEALGAVLWPIVHSAGALLFSEELPQVKECPGCGWLFLDTSKNQTRRWCSMDTCGARDKMRRYLKRKQGKKKTLR